MNYQTLKKRTEGFTIIEVLIVLAIAGLIMLIVFLAIPQIRRNQANTAIRAEASRILAAAVEFESNSNGQMISTDPQYDALITGVDRQQLTGAATAHTYATTNGTATQMNTVPNGTRIVRGTCNGTASTYSATARTYAVQYWLNGNTTGCAQS